MVVAHTNQRLLLCSRLYLPLVGKQSRELPADELRNDEDGSLFDRDAFGEVAGLVHVVAAQQGDVVGQELQR